MSPIQITPEHLVQRLTKARAHNIKIGQTIQLVSNEEEWLAEIENSFAQFVLVGIPENIGTRAAQLFIRSRHAFQAFLQSMLNLQDNLYLHGGDIFVLGTISVQDLADELKSLSVSKEKLYETVEALDKRVYSVAKALFSAGKIPIFIGGGQNNSYPILNALSDVNKTRVNCINISAHTSLLPPEGRHARNGFSYALLHDFLERYYVFGLHESDIPHSIYEFILANYKHIGFTRFEAILKNDPYLFEAIQEANEFVKNLSYGLEVNVNTISDISLSPDFPDGFLLREVRQLIRKICVYRQPAYFHICEAMYNERDSMDESTIGKSLALLVADFIKAFHANDEEE